jgi:hypothetical protein
MRNFFIHHPFFRHVFSLIGVPKKFNCIKFISGGAAGLAIVIMKAPSVTIFSYVIRYQFLQKIQQKSRRYRRRSVGVTRSTGSRSRTNEMRMVSEGYLFLASCSAPAFVPSITMISGSMRIILHLLKRFVCIKYFNIK